MITEDGRQIVCDGECGGKACSAQTPLPVALRPVLANAASLDTGAQGWLCVSSHDVGRHFCPICAYLYLQHATEENATRFLEKTRR